MSKGIEIFVIAVFIISVIAGPFSISSIVDSGSSVNADDVKNISLSKKFGLLENYNKGYEYYNSDLNTYKNSNELSGGYTYYIEDLQQYKLNDTSLQKGYEYSQTQEFYYE